MGLLYPQTRLKNVAIWFFGQSRQEIKISISRYNELLYNFSAGKFIMFENQIIMTELVYSIRID